MRRGSNFQYFKFNKQDFIVTNSSGQTSWVGKNKRAGFTFAGSGLVKLSYLKNGEVWMETIVPDEENKTGRVIHRKRLKDNVYGDPDDSTSITSSEYFPLRCVSQISLMLLNAFKELGDAPVMNRRKTNSFFCESSPGVSRILQFYWLNIQAYKYFFFV